MQRRLAAMVVVVTGALLIGTVLVTDLFSRSDAFDRLSDRTRASFSDQAIAQQRQDLAGMQTVSTSLATALPALGQQANLTEAQLQQFLAQFPDFTQGVAQMPAISQRMSTLVNTIDAEQQRFRAADAIPTNDQSTTSVPWFILIVGILAVVIGLAMAASRSGAWAIAAAVLGIIIIAVPLATSLPQKTMDADKLNDTLAAQVYTDETITGVQQASTTIGATATALQTQVLPAVATRLGLSVEQVQAGLVAAFPDLATALQNTPAALTRLGTTASTLAQTRSDFNEVNGTSYAPITWIVLGSGIAVLLMGTWAAVSGVIREQREERRFTRRMAA